MGRNCPRCHLCFWSRGDKRVADPLVVGGGASMSDDLHPRDATGGSGNDIHTPRSDCQCDTCMEIRRSQREASQSILETRIVEGRLADLPEHHYLSSSSSGETPIVFFNFPRQPTGVNQDRINKRDRKRLSLVMRLVYHLEGDANGIVCNEPQRIVMQWAKPDGTERWQIAPRFLSPDQFVNVVRDLERFGSLREVRPAQKHYKSVILFGAALPSCLDRVLFLQRCLSDGIRIDKVFVLSGERSLDPVGDCLAAGSPYLKAALSRVSTEHAGVMTMLQLTLLEFGKEHSRDIVVHPIGIHLQGSEESGMRSYPNDLLAELQRLHFETLYRESGSVLVVASQPHIPAFEAVLRKSWLAQYRKMEVVGPGIAVSDNTVTLDRLQQSPYGGWMCNYLSMTLDAIASWNRQMEGNWCQF